MEMIMMMMVPIAIVHSEHPRVSVCSRNAIIMHTTYHSYFLIIMMSFCFHFRHETKQAQQSSK